MNIVETLVKHIKESTSFRPENSVICILPWELEQLLGLYLLPRDCSRCGHVHVLSRPCYQCDCIGPLNRHDLTMTRCEPSESKARHALIEQGHDIHHGICSCGHWSIDVGLPESIKAIHSDHARWAREAKILQSCRCGAESDTIIGGVPLCAECAGKWQDAAAKWQSPVEPEPLTEWHASVIPFVARCGADRPGQSTTNIAANVTCENCISLMDADPSRKSFTGTDPKSLPKRGYQRSPLDGTPSSPSDWMWRCELHVVGRGGYETQVETWIHALSHFAAKSSPCELVVRQAGGDR